MAGIYIEKKTKYLPLITGLSAATNIIANFILIPLYSYTGAAIATLLSYIVMMLGIYYFSQKYYPIKYEYKKIALTFLALGVVTAIYFYTSEYFEIHWYLKFIFPASLTRQKNNIQSFF